MNKFKKTVSFITAGLVAASLFTGLPVFARDTMPDTWVAADDLGRELYTYGDVGGRKADKDVGIFYFNWLERNSYLYNIPELIRANPENPSYGPLGQWHWWSEPYFGYYLSDDEFVIYKHLQMLADAGVDFIMCDATNAVRYNNAYLAVMKTIDRMQKEGYNPPRFAIMTHFNSGPTLEALYNEIYSKNLYPNTWYYWQGKPLHLGNAEGASQEVKDFFTIRDCWAWTAGQEWYGDGQDKWPWLDNYPQNYGWSQSPRVAEQCVVSVAQHPTGNLGRSHSTKNGGQPAPENITPEKGIYFAEQWSRAYEVDPQVVFITGWNEWVAQTQVAGEGQPFMGKAIHAGEAFYVDAYNEEFSRDIEPMKGGFKDNYYYQMVSAIRRFKGARPIPSPSGQKAIDISGGFEQWADVLPEYLDDLYDVVHRDHPAAYTKLPNYTNSTGRNDIDACKVARDSENLYFYARCREAFVAKSEENFMVLYVNADANYQTGWYGYDFKITPANGRVLKWENGAFTNFAQAEVNLGEAELQLSVAKDVLAQGGLQSPITLDFKWADNFPENGEPQQFIDQGDAAPNARFNYRFTEKEQDGVSAELNSKLGGVSALCEGAGRMVENGMVKSAVSYYTAPDDVLVPLSFLQNACRCPLQIIIPTRGCSSSAARPTRCMPAHKAPAWW